MTAIPRLGGANTTSITPTTVGALGDGVTDFPGARLAVPIDEAAPLLDVSYNTLWRAVRENQFAGVRIRDRIVIPIAALGDLRVSPSHKRETASLAIGLRNTAKLIGVSYNTLWRASAEGQFPMTRIRSRVLVPRPALDSLLDAAVASAALIDAAVWTAEWKSSLMPDGVAA
ncbi:hypothetical protein [Catenulispora pinisilvae]|uniref:hypothetical protein n=1 Tax=Catenulispora pinisilvae TaxID=2705253 RepID=UPI001890BBF1|nr:hypothetical protein [Catenulispora pinisilvae]